MQLDRDMGHNNRIKLMVHDGQSVGHVVRNILKGIFHRIMVVGLKSIVHRRRILSGMLGRAFLVSMQC